ncbi:MAG TPA: amidohydrolase family protein [Limnochordia bacterium]|nr:amidohydrolase family protein [Limnochordia bacterium]
MQLIDSHQHVFWHGRDDAGLVADLDEHGIERAWLLTWEEPVESAYAAVLDPRRHPMGANASSLPFDGVMEAVRRYPDRFIPGYCPHPLDPHAVAKLNAAIDIHGVKVCGEWKFCLLFDDPRCLELYRLAGRRGLPVVLHLDVPYLPPKGGRYVGNGLWKGGTIANLERALQACPETNFIGHAPGFWRELTGDADERGEAYLKAPLAPGGKLPGLFERYPNLYADLSAGSALRALKADPAQARALLLRFVDRFLFGRDYYGGDLAAFLRELDLPEAAWQKIGRENAERLIAEAGRGRTGGSRL